MLEVNQYRIRKFQVSFEFVGVEGFSTFYLLPFALGMSKCDKK